MSEYTPDTEEVRDKYIGQGFVDGELKEYTEFARERIGAEFDRWLTEVERAAAEKEWDEAEATLERVRAVIIRAGTYGPDEFGAFKRDLAVAALDPVTEEGDKE